MVALALLSNRCRRRLQQQQWQHWLQEAVAWSREQLLLQQHWVLQLLALEVQQAAGSGGGVRMRLPDVRVLLTLQLQLHALQRDRRQLAALQAHNRRLLLVVMVMMLTTQQQQQQLHRRHLVAHLAG